MRRKRALIVVSGWALAGGCGMTQRQAPQAVPQMVPYAAPEPLSPPLMPYSSWPSDEYSEVEFSGKGGKGLTVPHRVRANDAVELIVRPDVFTAEFAVRDVKPTFEEALVATKTMSETIGAALGALPGGTASLKLRGTAVARVMRTQQPIGVSVTVDGLMEVKIGDDLNFWGRSRLYATLMETTARLTASARSDTEPLRAVRFEDVQPNVQNPEDYRSQLLERWVTRTRAFATLAESKGAPLSLVDCAPPGPVTAARVSLEEAALQLAVLCRIDTPGHEASH